MNTTITKPEEHTLDKISMHNDTDKKKNSSGNINNYFPNLPLTKTGQKTKPKTKTVVDYLDSQNLINCHKQTLLYVTMHNPMWGNFFY